MHGLHQVKPLSGNILILIHNNVPEGQLLPPGLRFPQDLCRLINHILKINCMVFLQKTLIFQIAVIADIKEQPCTLIFRCMVHTAKGFCFISVCFKINNKTADQCEKLFNIPVLLRCHKLFHNLLIRTGPELESVPDQRLFKMFCQASLILIGGKCIDQIRPVTPVKKHLVIYRLLILI